MKTQKILILGGGGREHALAWKIAQSDQVLSVYTSPGNAGTAQNGKITNVDLKVKDFPGVVSWCKENCINLVIVGPEDPLAAGIADFLQEHGIECFGPSAKAAQIEASKEFAKNFMIRHDIPTARFKTFTKADEACEHIRSAPYKALVVKASGLAAGKGVVVARSVEEACQSVKDNLEDKIFGAAGETVIIEELLEGEEVSCLAFTDGNTVAMMPPAQDHKRLKDGDSGPNTGGMGAYCPYPKITESELKLVKETVLQKAVDGLRSEGMPFVGVLYAGLMLTADGPKVLEYNCRFGDPETQSILPLLKSDLLTVCTACVNGTLQHTMPEFDSVSKVLGVVVVSGGYPGSYKKNLPLTGLEEAEASGVTVFHAGTSLQDGQIVTSGGRVLAVVAKEKDFQSASDKAQKGASLIKFTDAFYRRDIGHKILSRGVQNFNSLSYKAAGVDITAGNSLVELIKPLAKATQREGCEAALGSFGAIFNLHQAKYTEEPLLVSGTDGVGTKLKVAQNVGFHKSVGIDLVAMVVNDILAHGAEPLFFLDYFACAKLDVLQARDVIEGIAEGCKLSGCALVGGETAEMPGMYQKGDYDLAGFAVGAVEAKQLLPRLADITVGDAVIGLASSGIHSNGFSLVRKIIEVNQLSYDMHSPISSGKTLGEELLCPTKIYVKSVLPLMRQNLVKAFAHITGGGLVENIPRVLPRDLAVQLDAMAWNVPPIFGWLQMKGKVSESEMARTYNCGIGAILIVENQQANFVRKSLENSGEKSWIIGSVVKQQDNLSVNLMNLAPALQGSCISKLKNDQKKKVAVLISGSGTNLQSLINFTQNPQNNSSAEIALVISNKPNVGGLNRAQRANIPTMVINHKEFKSREAFDEFVHEELIRAKIEIVCLAGFMRILSAPFVRKWQGAMLNVHPSLLPSFKGANAHKLVLEAGVKLTGCSVHFVAPEVDSGAILVQKSAPVYPNDTEDTLSERVKQLEHVAYPEALELLASGEILLQENGKILWRDWC
ncbi:trifunctional purine biosynthetic protein adenosine-3 isoform X2 [Octopus sinensis]|uniref:Trifunctional purine biosynthetic protein adenosine-3 n=1 Tax=Octopus sinensis TaxID=2607531 RepID=A0A6P7S6S5_9MOLL|nr:trifunctional purine biosynthetic protein adenosine-3 isoform X1 [Octopus sinensis]XP_036357363.1 trifunctional purine biosynthetic protein adenosine-3 isoform X2 [Octopus sinensis]